MRQQQLQAALICAFSGLYVATDAVATEVAMCTDAGRIVIELADEEAPQHVGNFLRNVKDGYYTGTVFHRVIDNFMVQGGGFSRNLQFRTPTQTVENESRNGLSNSRGTVAAARTADPHSAATQFFINTVDNSRLDADRSDWGYTVFGEVTEGMDVVDTISRLPTDAAGPFADDVPNPLIAILAISVLDRAALAELDGPDPHAALLGRIDAAEETNSPAETLEWISHYRASCAPAGPDLLVTEARSAVALERVVQARFALEEFFATAPTTHRDYSAAEVLYQQVTGRSSLDTDVTECAEPEAPGMPDGTRETLDGMLAAQNTVQEFMRASTDYLECMDEVIVNVDSQPDSEDLSAELIAAYNRVVELTQQVGDDFNREVRAFRARQ